MRSKKAINVKDEEKKSFEILMKRVNTSGSAVEEDGLARTSANSTCASESGATQTS
jgi:hypothetical protein